MKNVLIINLARQYGGAEKVTEDIILNLNKEKYNVFLICLNGSKFYNEIINKDYENISILTLPYGKTSIFKYFTKTIKYLNMNNIELIHAHGVVSSLVGTVCGNITGKKVITTIHGRADFDRNKGLKANIFKHLESLLLNYNEYYLTVSRDLKNYMVSKGLKESKILVLHNGISEKIEIERNINYKENFFEREDFMIVSIGRLTKVKGHIYLLQALKKIKDMGGKVKCLIVGEGELEQYINDKVLEYNLENMVRLIGFNKDIDNILSSCDVVVMTSLMEGLPLTILEAFRNETIVLAPSVGGIPEVINTNEDGILYTCKNTQELADKIMSIRDGKYDLANMKKNALRKLHDNFTIDKFIQRTEKIYDET
jgi:glycosyltransferase involved in cell wall biosynthesis